MTYINTDAICSVLASSRDQANILRVLEFYLPNRTKLNGDYCEHPTNPGHVFEDEEEIIKYFETNISEEVTLYWNNHAEKIMVGAYFTKDGMLIMSITMGADGKKEELMLHELQGLLNSEVGMITYNSLPNVGSGEEFKRLADAES